MLGARTKKAALAVAGLAAGFVGVVGVAHTPWGRPMLGWLQGAPGCPIGAELDPAAAAAVRAQLTAPLVGPEHGASIPVLGGLLPGQSTRAQARAWSVAHGLRCTTNLSHQDRCGGVLLGRDDAQVVMRYDDARLLDVEVSFRSPDAQGAFSMAQTLDAELGRDAEPWRAQGATDSEALAMGPLAQSRREYRFSDLRTEVRATNLGRRGYWVRGFAQALTGGDANARPAS